MNKELEAVKDLRSAFISHCKELSCDENYIKVCENNFSDIEAILRDYEKKDKALEIIKKYSYYEHFMMMIRGSKDYEEYKKWAMEENDNDPFEEISNSYYTQEEYDLLKKVLL